MVAKEEFARRYFHWARAFALAECRRGFPLVRSVNGTNASKAVRFLMELSPEARETGVTGLVKRFHAHAVPDLVLDDEELALTEAYLESARRPLPDHAKQRLIDGMEARRFLAPRVVGLGIEEIEAPDDDTWAYRSHPVPGTEVRTYLRHRHPVLYFHHALRDGRIIQKQVSLLAWLGMASQTTWDRASDWNEQLADSVVASIAAFLKAAPDLFAA